MKNKAAQEMARMSWKKQKQGKSKVEISEMMRARRSKRLTKKNEKLISRKV